MTSLPNRALILDRIEQMLGRARRDHVPTAAMFLDLDDFKQVNDVHGHHSGDEVLRLAAERLVAISRGADQVARLGGDEFAIILADVHRDDQVRAAEQRVRAAFVDPFVICDIPVSIGTSIGGVVWPEDGDTVNELVRRADAAMYRDKAEKHKRSIHALT